MELLEPVLFFSEPEQSRSHRYICSEPSVTVSYMRLAAVAAALRSAGWRCKANKAAWMTPQVGDRLPLLRPKQPSVEPYGKTGAARTK